MNLDNWVFENCTLSDESFVKALRIFETCASVNNDLCGRLVWSLELSIKFNESFKVISISFSIFDYNLSSWELDNFRFRILYLVILYQYFNKIKRAYNTFTVPLENIKLVLSLLL